MSPRPPDVNDLLEAVRGLGPPAGHPGPGWYLTREVAAAMGVCLETARHRMLKAQWDQTVRSGPTGCRLTFWRPPNGHRPAGG